MSERTSLKREKVHRFGIITGLFFKLGKGLFKAGEVASTALEAVCLGMSAAQIHFECGSIYGNTCSVSHQIKTCLVISKNIMIGCLIKFIHYFQEIQEQGKKAKSLSEKSDSLLSHKHVFEKMKRWPQHPYPRNALSVHPFICL